MLAAIIGFAIGILTRRFQDNLGKKFVDPWLVPFMNAVYEDVSEWPRVAHRLEGHGAKWSTNCDQCRLGTPNNVDTLS